MTEEEKKAKINEYANSCARLGETIISIQQAEQQRRQLQDKCIELLAEIKAAQ